ncbi:uncharacterized protein TNCV_1931081 [Trichonephila clavipes]|nr:uncharacterized protein TNCV_1931081 [Trichonephila clavipes]
MQNKHCETTALRKNLTTNEIANLLRQLSENELAVIYIPMNIRLNESDCEEFEVNADVIDNIPVNADIYVTRDDTDWIPHNSNVPGRFTPINVLQPSSIPTRFAKNNVNRQFFFYINGHNTLKCH